MRKRVWIVGLLALLIVLGASSIFFYSVEARDDERILALLGLRPGDTAAEIGAGDGRMTLKAAAWVGPAGHVYSTEVELEKRNAIVQAADNAGLTNVSVVEALASSVNLPRQCCDALFLRRVYHHISERKAFGASLFEATKPGGRVAVMDFAPTRLRFLRSDHGVEWTEVRDELVSSGFTLAQQVHDWRPADTDVLRRLLVYDYYCLIFYRET